MPSKNPKPLKVYGSRPSCREYVPKSLSPHRQTRHIVAAASLTEACRLMGTRRAYTSQTGNEAEIAAAMAVPGVVLWQTDRSGPVFAPVPTRRTGEGE